RRQRARDGGREVRGAGNRARARQRIAQRCDRLRIVQTVQQQRLRARRGGHDFDGDLGHHGQGAKAAGEQLGKIKSRDVLDHATTGGKRLSEAIDALYTEKMIARRARAWAARTTQTHAEAAAERTAAGRFGPESGEVRRFEGELLTL